MPERLLVCTVGGLPYYGSKMEFDLVRMKEGDRVRYTVNHAHNGKHKSGVGKFLYSSVITGELHAEVQTDDGRRVAVFPSFNDLIEKEAEVKHDD